jgi:hypothetical protein
MRAANRSRNGSLDLKICWRYRFAQEIQETNPIASVTPGV